MSGTQTTVVVLIFIWAIGLCLKDLLITGPKRQREDDARWDAIHARGASPCPHCSHPCDDHWDGCRECDCTAGRRELFAGCI